jgi:hypothetical protein
MGKGYDQENQENVKLLPPSCPLSLSLFLSLSLSLSSNIQKELLVDPEVRNAPDRGAFRSSRIAIETRPAYDAAIS